MRSLMAGAFDLTAPEVKREPMAESKRLAFLEKTTADGSKDPLAWYGLAMEYRKLERWDEALQTFTTLRTANPDYVAMYLMCGQMLESITRTDEAREWLEAGVAAAKKKGDSHAISELEAALLTLDDA
jgi:predicted Zn-dependent protease